MRRVLLAVALLAGAAAGATEEVEVSGYGQVRYVDQQDVSGDEWQLNQFRLKFTINMDAQTRIVIQGEETYKNGTDDFNWVDAYLQHRWPSATTVRAGLARVPFGFDNLQTTRNRVPLDSPVAISRLLPGKRDQGFYASYSPTRYSRRFRQMESSDFGAGDYGLLAAGWYGGQGRDHDPEGLDHLAMRLAYPIVCGHGQAGEMGASYFSGDYRTVQAGGAALEIKERAWGLHAFMAPRPLGFLAEYVKGTMPGVSGEQTLSAEMDGWYVQAMYRLNRQSVLYARRDEFDGFRKTPDSQPGREDYSRTSVGWRCALSPSTDLTIEYEDIERNGAEADRATAQVMVSF